MIGALLWTLVLPSPRQAPAPDARPPTLVRVFVHTDETGEADELGGRRDSVRDLRDALASKKKTVEIVTSADQADVVLEVVDRTMTIPKFAFGGVSSTDRLPGSGPPTPVRNVHLKTKLVYRDQFMPFANKNSPIESNGGWKSAADDIAKQLDTWIAAHRTDLLAGRQG